ncbi:MAG: sarcosine oxidase subunit alpha [Candidatus Poriferisodalaceae bacterium]|jgi:sarcosine oxidase subunit alpha
MKEQDSVADLSFESPITSSYSTSSSNQTLTDISATTKVLVRASVDSAAAATLGVSYGTLRREGDTIISGSRPDEWMILGNVDGVAAVVGGLDTSGHVSVVDFTHGRAMFRLAGPTSASVLEKVCGLDFADNMTPNRAVVSASVAKVGCDLARDDQDGVLSYLILCDRSFGQYLLDAVLDAGNEYDLNPVAQM